MISNTMIQREAHWRGFWP